jgi:hypothetical protein
LPDFSARYLKIAPDSQTETVAPPGPSWSTIAGI